MNVKITKEQHEYLKTYDYEEYLFGSQLHGIATEKSDFDYIRVIPNTFYLRFETLAAQLPNIHSWQYDGENNTQYVWMTQKQFYHNLFSGDGNMIADVVILSEKFDNALFLCRTYKIIKAYIGVAKRDLKLHGDNKKKRFHALRSLFMAEKLMNNELPTVKGIQLLNKIFNDGPTSKETLLIREQQLREQLNEMLNKGDLTMYPLFKETNDLVQIMTNSNNITQFKYD